MSGAGPADATRSPTLLMVRDLSVSFRMAGGLLAITGKLNFSIAAGERLGMVGESGCGKTVTGLSLLRLLPERHTVIDGQILFNGQDLAKLPAEAMRQIGGRDIAMIFQEPMTALDPVFSVGEQIGEAYRTHFPASRAEAQERAVHALARVGIPLPARRHDEYPHQLSGGMRQRVMIAMALVCEPKLLIADEPTTALDVTVQAQITDLLRDLSERAGTALLAEASLRFLGLGIQPPNPRWGSMLARAHQNMETAPVQMFPPGLAILFTALAFNTLGEALRVALDPTMKR